ncbi:hypothetical protein LSTR_LSTR005858 [Laodelphax striatellus]|uniref:Voltage-dependent anion-selective channel protein 3 n=1 Tax=Laodelphax striatellus TaxID=195883 RepID=A0A482WS14_LAOST|nr:hypothetical protein LSTR_LSTR005858 [Laodelphax striatellus]
MSNFCSPWTHAEGGLPFYGELGKKIRDVFGSYSGAGLFNINVSGVLPDHGIKLSDSLHANKETGDVAGTIATLFHSERQNILFGQKWTSNNDLTAEFTLVDFCQGAQAKLAGTVNTKNDKKSLLVGTECRNDKVALNLAAEFKSKSPVVKGSIAGGYENISIGYFTNFTSENSKFVTHDFRISYDHEKFSLLGALENEFKVVTAAIQGKLAENIDGALEVKNSKGGDDDGITVAMGVKYTQEEYKLRCKVDSKAIIGLSFDTKVNETTSLNLCTLIEGNDIFHGKHKIGFGLLIGF